MDNKNGFRQLPEAIFCQVLKNQRASRLASYSSMEM